MNLLAHAALAYLSLDELPGVKKEGEIAAFLTGSLMADFCRGCNLADYSGTLALAIQQHRAIDYETDASSEFIACRQALAAAGAPRHTASILVDMFWGHILAADWKQLVEPGCGLDLSAFSSLLYGILNTVRQDRKKDDVERANMGAEIGVSPAFARAAVWMVDYHWFEGLARRSGIAQSLQGLSRRLSGADELAKSISLLDTQEELLRKALYAFWPRLVAFSRQWAADHCEC